MQKGKTLICLFSDPQKEKGLIIIQKIKKQFIVASQNHFVYYIKAT